MECTTCTGTHGIRVCRRSCTAGLPYSRLLYGPICDNAQPHSTVMKQMLASLVDS
jgi:hypothetical protein